MNEWTLSEIKDGELVGLKVDGAEIVFNAPKANWNHFNIFVTGKFAKVKAPKGTDYAKMDGLMSRDSQGGWRIQVGEIKEIVPQLGGRVYLDIAATAAYIFQTENETAG